MVPEFIMLWTNTGGGCPKCGSGRGGGEVTYLIRAPKPDQVKSLYERVLF